MSDTDKLIALCDLLSWMIYGNQEHWQTLGFHEFLHDVKSAFQSISMLSRDEAISALKVIYTWATFDKGQAFNRKDVISLCASVLKRKGPA